MNEAPADYVFNSEAVTPKLVKEIVSIIQQKITVPEYSGKEFIGEELFGRALSSQKNSMLKFKVSEEFDWERNHPLTPGGLSEWSKDKVWWKCSMCGKGWNCTVSHRIKKLNDRLGCADCRGGAR